MSTIDLLYNHPLYTHTYLCHSHHYILHSTTIKLKMKYKLTTPLLLKYTMSQQPIPYVISIAHPDNKRPYLEQEFGEAADEYELDELLLNSISTFIYDHNPAFMNDVKHDITENDIQEYFLDYYQDSFYMDNQPWSCSIFTDNKWRYRMPLDADIVKRLTEFRQENCLPSDIECEEESEDDDKDFI